MLFRSEYTWKSMWEYFKPQRGGHGSYWYRWSVQNEIEWKEQYRLWMQFINDYKNRGGRVCTGSDSGFIFQIYGFGYIRELELLQEAGFNPLEVLRAATIQGAALCGLDEEIGSLEVGKRADILVHDVNPLTDFKLLYGTGALRLNEERNTGEYVRGLRYTIADGVVYDTAELLADVRDLVAKSWEGEEASQAVVAPSLAQSAGPVAKPKAALKAKAAAPKAAKKAAAKKLAPAAKPARTRRREAAE